MPPDFPVKKNLIRHGRKDDRAAVSGALACGVLPSVCLLPVEKWFLNDGSGWSHYDASNAAISSLRALASAAPISMSLRI